MHIRFGSPSPALVISVIALFVALGGTGYAAATGSIDGREIKNSTIQSKDVKNSSLTGTDTKNNSLTGSDVAESSLGKVPSATSADRASSATSAASAGNANTVGGQPASAFASSNVGRAFSVSLNTDLNDYAAGDVVTLAVPAGQYAVTAQISHDNDSPAGDTVCTLTGGGLDSATEFSESAGTGEPDGVSVSLVGLANSASAFTIAVNCQNTGGDDDIQSRQIVAVRTAG